MFQKTMVSLCLALTSAGCLVKKNASAIKVTNGQRTVQLPAVVRITNLEGGSCTATFIRANVLLTAAHCVKDRNIPVVVKQLEVASNNIFVHPNYVGASKDPNDVALVFFSDAVADQFLPVDYNLPAPGEPVQLIGFGDNQFTDGLNSTGSSEIKRTGFNQVDQVGDGKITVVGQRGANAPDNESPDGKLASLASGDSGGPLVSKSGAVIGIASFVSMPSETAIRSSYTSLASVREFVESTLSNNAKVSANPFVAKCKSQIKSYSVKFLFNEFASDTSCDTLYAALAATGNLNMFESAKTDEVLDLSLLKDITWLRSIKTKDVKLSDFEALSNNRSLTRITLKNSGIKDSSVLSKIYSLQVISIDDVNELSPEPITTLPNIMSVNINGKSFDTKNILRNQVFGGTWRRDCHRLTTSQPEQYAQESFLYSQSISTIQYVAKVYLDSTCSKQPILAIKTDLLMKMLMPIDDKSTYTSDFNISTASNITIYDDTWVKATDRQAFRKNCPYEIGKPISSCGVNGAFEPFTLVKRDGNNFFIGTNEKQEQNDGKSKDKRQTELDPVPFVKISDNEEYGYLK